MKCGKLVRGRKMLMTISHYIGIKIKVEIGKYCIMKQTVTKPVSEPKQSLEYHFDEDAYFDEDGDSAWIEEMR